MDTKRLLTWLGAGLLLPAIAAIGGENEVWFRDSFDAGLGHWSVQQPDYITVIEEPGAPGNSVLQLQPREEYFVHATLKDSANYRNLRFEGDLLFPTDGDGYLGLIYNYQEHNGRADFGVLFIKSNDSYVRVSPHYDSNPSWRLHEELKTPLTGAQHIEPNRWYHFRLDVLGNGAALYLDDLATPVVVYEGFEQDFGAIGLEARPGRGDPVWVDNLEITSLPAGYTLPAASVLAYTPGDLITEWEVAGPFPPDEGETSQWVPAGLDAADWRDFTADERGMVSSGRVTEYLGERHLAWFRFRFDFGSAGTDALMLKLSTANPIGVWLNGEWQADVPNADYAWFDFLTVNEHAGATVQLHPQRGENTLLLRVDGDHFASGGFYAALIAGD
jgi:hypothetical protein